MSSIKLNYKRFCLFAILIIFSTGILGCTLENNLRNDGYSISISDDVIEEKVSKVRENLRYITIDNISSNFLDALVAIEDNRFYKHGGVDIKSIVRATIANIKAKSIIQGGSTITQQLAKNLFLDGDQDMSRKISEIIIARKIEKLYSKEEILELYANVVYYGNGYYGINDASYGYFNSSPKNLTLNQGSLLAGLLQAPNSYNPKKYLAKAQGRQEEVLDAMVKYGYITKEQMKNIIN